MFLKKWAKTQIFCSKPTKQTGIRKGEKGKKKEKEFGVVCNIKMGPGLVIKAIGPNATVVYYGPFIDMHFGPKKWVEAFPPNFCKWQSPTSKFPED